MSRFWKPGSEKPSTFLVDDEEGGVVFLPSSTSSASSSGFGYASLERQRQRQRLPVYRYRKAILYLVERHATTIVVGETGSGKSTQIPQYLKEAGWADGGRLIGCTQPRRLAVQKLFLSFYQLHFSKKKEGCINFWSSTMDTKLIWLVQSIVTKSCSISTAIVQAVLYEAYCSFQQFQTSAGNFVEAQQQETLECLLTEMDVFVETIYRSYHSEIVLATMATKFYSSTMTDS